MMSEGEAEQFSLRWNNFHSNLTAGFHALLQGEDLVDVTLAADGQFIRAHKIVLSVCSPYFKELFKVNPCKHPIVILKDVSHKDLVAILQFMYQGEVNVRQEELTTFLKTAEMLQIKGLTGDESTNEEETLPVPPAPVQRPRVVRRVTEKAPHAARATVEKKPQPAPEMLTIEPEEAPVQPPYKRIRPEVSTASPVVTEESVTPARSSSSVEYVEISKPKVEPTEYETEVEEIDRTPSNRDDPLVQLLGGESSQSLQDSPQGTGLFAGIPGVSQDSGLSQDSGQGKDRKKLRIISWKTSRTKFFGKPGSAKFIKTEFGCKKEEPLSDNMETTFEPSCSRDKRRRCQPCYTELKKDCRTKYVCAKCKTFLCLSKHAKIICKRCLFRNSSEENLK